jgi:hypothetical protein
MTLHSRAILMIAGLMACPASGCLLVSGPPANAVENTLTSDPPAKTGFASMPPGTRISASSLKPVKPAEIAKPPQTLDTGITGGPLLVGVGGQSLPPDRLPQPATETPLLAAVRAYVENRPDKAIECLKLLDRPNQEFVLALLPVLARGSQLNLTSPASATDIKVMIEALRLTASRLEPHAAISIEKMLFCKRVQGFGRYEPWQVEQPYRPNGQAELYVEIRHLLSEPGVSPGQGEGYITKLVSSLEIRDANGKLVEQTDPADFHRTVAVSQFERAVFSRSPLQDFFMTYQFRVGS